MGAFAKSLVRLRSAIKTLPSEDVDPEYYSLMEDNLMDKFEALQARIIEALAWERRRTARNADPLPGTADIKVIADREQSVMTILINEHKTNVECLLQVVIDMRKKIKAVVDIIDKLELPKPMKTTIFKSLQQIIYCISLEASVPYRLKNEIEDFLTMLQQPHPLNTELADMVKLMKVKAENCLADSNREHHHRKKALKHIDSLLEELDGVLAETKRPYWMIDIPDVCDHRKRAFKTELFGYTETLKKKYNILPQEEHLGCVCYRTRKDRKGSREIPLCPQLLEYTEEVRKRMNLEPFRKEGNCYCPWLYAAPDCSGGTTYSLPLRQYTTSIKARAVTRDAVRDVTCCHCYWMKLQRVFAGLNHDACFSAEDLS
uniref:Threonine--tRNA ligase n=1 Tax=Lygus hesperus TaxID=30085 RepID=A0A0A9WYS1_LYGHE